MVESPLVFVKPREPKPEWLKVRAPGSENYHRLKGLMRSLGLHTVLRILQREAWRTDTSGR